jgi:hypothetical protein
MKYLHSIFEECSAANRTRPVTTMAHSEQPEGRGVFPEAEYPGGAAGSVRCVLKIKQVLLIFGQVNIR